MSNKVTYNQNQLRDYSSLFSRSDAELWMKSNFESIDYKIERYDIKWQNFSNATYLDYLKYVYQILENYYQNEYIFKNSFLNEWLIKEIGQNNTKVFNEFRVGNAVADLVMFNGKSKVFEIKTEFDSTKRLNLQIENYSKAFNQIFLIVPESKLSIYSKIDKNIGLISFNNNEKLEKFILQRDAFTNSEVDYDTIMKVLHTNEYKSIVESFYGELPIMTSFNQYNICKELIKKIPNNTLNKKFIEKMKSRNLENALSNRYYKEFNQISLALKLTKKDREIMIKNLKSQIKL
ncbi:sce7726 family protein [Flavobacterium difficile]|uniref:Sce7726 family protein n=1 Tax=Flavobacterium difficile TaxID=2709659 RepID=A0ABX0I176_9FLAO|nr:sce7726 family protein [Flavobacterium difficile]NHM00954.1 sce7726 family protein [Flavobacterium difficile]